MPPEPRPRARRARRTVVGVASRAVAVVALLAAIAVPSATVGADDESTAAGTGGAPPPGPAPAPVPAPARTDAPLTVAVVGDSISQGTGANGPGAPGGGLGSPRPAASWATGRQDGLGSYVQRLEAATGRAVTAWNLSANGATVRDHLVDQVRTVPEATDLVLVQMGGNDLCRPSVEEMTPVDTVRSEVRAALTWLRENRPDLLVLVSSIPDIYSLWYVRGASHRGEQLPLVGFFVSGRDGPRAPRSFVENNNKRAARFLWETLEMVPCRALLDNPDNPRNAGPTPDPTHPDEQRRLRVRAHTIALNEVLAEECAAVLRCLHDGDAVFDLVSNRDESGVLLADKDQWRFVDADISTQDHFHPSFQGQAKLAATVWDAGPDWSDTDPPTPIVGVRPSLDRAAAAAVPTGARSGWWQGPVSVDVVYRDAQTRVAGIEHRVHGPHGPAGPWTATTSDRVEVPVVADGVSWVEIRALDANGNLSASELVEVRIDRDAPTITIAEPLADAVVVLGAPVVARYGCDDRGSGVEACAGSSTAGALVPTATVGEHRLEVRAVDAAGRATTRSRTYRVRYASTLTVTGGTGRVVRRGEPATVHVGVSDARGHGVPESTVDVVLVGPDGTERGPRSWLEPFGVERVSWSSTHAGHLLVVDTRALDPGVWQVVARLDDGTEHRVELVVRG